MTTKVNLIRRRQAAAETTGLTPVEAVRDSDDFGSERAVSFRGIRGRFILADEAGSPEWRRR